MSPLSKEWVLPIWQSSTEGHRGDATHLQSMASSYSRAVQIERQQQQPWKLKLTKEAGEMTFPKSRAAYQ